eukprot:7187741-Prymnesium_polylepis.1
MAEAARLRLEARSAKEQAINADRAAEVCAQAQARAKPTNPARACALAAAAPCSLSRRHAFRVVRRRRGLGRRR